MRGAPLHYLNKRREADKFRGFSYHKIIVDSDKIGFRKAVPNKVIAWEVSYRGEYLARFKNLIQAQDFIRFKANT